MALVHSALDQARAGNATGAVATLKRAIARDPDSPDAHSTLGAILLQSGELRRFAEPELRAAIRLHPNFAPAQNNLASALDDLGRFDEAAFHFEIAIKLQEKLQRGSLQLRDDAEARASRFRSAEAIAGDRRGGVGGSSVGCG